MRRKIYHKLYKLVVEAIYPLHYAKKIGVNIKGKLYIYGKVNWSTEPWLITIGDNCHITNGAALKPMMVGHLSSATCTRSRSD